MSETTTDETLRIEETINQQLNAYRTRAQTIRQQIGEIEITKGRLFNELLQIESFAQSLLNDEAKRLGIPDGEAWSVSPDGVVTRNLPPQVG